MINPSDLLRLFRYALLIAGTVVYLGACLPTEEETETEPPEQPGNTTPPETNPPETEPPPAAIPPDIPAVFRTFDEGVVYSNTIYVSPDGVDMNADGSLGAPYGSIRAALQNASPGTKVMVQAGRYGAVGQISNLHADATTPIALVADGEVIVDAGGGSVAMHMSDPRYFVMDGIIFENATNNGLNIDDGGSYDTPAEFVVLRNLTFRNIGSTAGRNNDCLKMSGVDNFHVMDIEFESCQTGNSGSGIDMVGCHDGVLAGNAFYGIVGSGIQAKGGSADLLIHGNRFVDGTGRNINAGGSTDDRYYRPIDAVYDAARLQIIANVFENVGVAGNANGVAVAFVGCDNCVFANNTIIEPHGYITRILQERQEDRFVPSRDGYFVNNIIMLNTSDVNGAYVNIGVGPEPSSFTFANNLWYAMDNPDYTGPNLSGVPPETGALIQQDPQFVNMNAGDFHLQSSSPAIGRGTSVPRGVDADFDRELYADPLDIGAFNAP